MIDQYKRTSIRGLWTKFGSTPKNVWAYVHFKWEAVSSLGRNGEDGYSFSIQGRTAYTVYGDYELFVSAPKYNDLGHVCPLTGRRAITVEEAAQKVGVYFTFDADRTHAEERPWAQVTQLSESSDGSILLSTETREVSPVSLGSVVYSAPAEPAPTGSASCPCCGSAQFTDAQIDDVIALARGSGPAPAVTAALRADIRALLANDTTDPLLPAATEILRRWPECSPALLSRKLQVGAGRAETLYAAVKDQK